MDSIIPPRLHRDLLVRTKPIYDGPVPSGNATAALVLLRLAKFLDNADYFSKAERLLASVAASLRDQPRAHPSAALRGGISICRPPWKLQFAGRRGDEDTESLLSIIHRRFIPNKVLALVASNAESGGIEPAIPWLANKQMISEKPTVYLCKGAGLHAGH